MPTVPLDIRLVCGLGNPGREYERTRHTVGFAAVDILAAEHGVRYWKHEAGCLVASLEVSTGAGQRREVLLVKPQGFMNTSGGPLSKLARAHHIVPAELLVIHDEVDLATGCVTVKWGGGLNAHNGLRSIASKLGTRDFSRIVVVSEDHRARWMSQRMCYVSSKYPSGRIASACIRCCCLCQECLVRGVSWVCSQQQT
jgi:PTH1 family peptidyl-tRNA hydrolase